MTRATRMLPWVKLVKGFEQSEVVGDVSFARWCLIKAVDVMVVKNRDENGRRAVLDTRELCHAAVEMMLGMPCVKISHTLAPVSPPSLSQHASPSHRPSMR